MFFSGNGGFFLIYLASQFLVNGLCSSTLLLDLPISDNFLKITRDFSTQELINLCSLIKAISAEAGRKLCLYTDLYDKIYLASVHGLLKQGKISTIIKN